MTDILCLNVLKVFELLEMVLRLRVQRCRFDLGKVLASSRATQLESDPRSKIERAS